jgi:three-Cys-motif partner protein
MNSDPAHEGNGKRRKRPRDVPDDADEKWDYPQHTAAKHEILRRYLGAWLTILGRRKGSFQRPELILIDGFAGRGRYTEGSPGSPAIMFQRAVEVADAGQARKVRIRCSEPNETNFKHLKEVCDGLRHASVKIKPTQERFEDVAQKYIVWANAQRPNPPTFVMVDPYGIRGVRLDTLRELLAFDRLEVLLTFMVRDPARFLNEPNYEQPLTELFGGRPWEVCEHAEDRPECLMRTFREVVRPSVAKHATPFKVFEDEKRTVLYYLVHLTNNDLGMRVMKEQMVRESGEMTFFPITIRPTDWLTLDVAEQPPFPTLQAHLLRKYAGQSLGFEALLTDDYPEGHPWVEKDYKKALGAMEQDEPPRVRIVRREPLTPTGKAKRRIEYDDAVEFIAAPPLL